MAVEKLSVSLLPEVVEKVAERGDHRSTEINRALDRYYWLMDDCQRRELAALFRVGERGLILDALNGVAFADLVSVRLAAHSVADAISVDGLDKKWSVDGEALVEKLQGRTMVQIFALVDAVSVWWERVARGEEITPAELF